MPEIHKTAEVSEKAKIGENTSIWHHSQVRENSVIGNNCILGKNVYVDHDVKIGDNVKIQNNVSIYFGVKLEDGVFVGPHVSFMNDKVPRAINPDGSLKTSGNEVKDWKVSKTLVKMGASIGTGALIMPGIKIGKFAMVGAGSLVTKDVPDYGLVYGNPARLHGYACKCGETIKNGEKCEKCGFSLKF